MANKIGTCPVGLRETVLGLWSTERCSGKRWYFIASMSKSLQSGVFRINSSLSTRVIKHSLVSRGSLTNGNRSLTNSLRLSTSNLTQFITALYTCSSFSTFTSLLEMRSKTCSTERSINSSVCETCKKCWRAKRCEDSNKSTQVWVSAKARIPRQFEGWSWFLRNSQQASFTLVSCNKLDAGSKACTLSSLTWMRAV